jgi:hypothetical protein
MVNILDKMCEHYNCKIRASFNYETEKKPKFCTLHKLNEMCDVCNNTCQYDKCKSKPNFNYINEKKGIYCSKHKLDNMVDVVHNKCKFKNCNVQPNYNYPNNKIGIYCTEHKLEGMVDVKNKKCEYNNCLKQAHYNYLNEKTGIYCGEHKLNNMINIISKTCIHPNCKTRPVFNNENKYEGLYCLEHKKENMVNVLIKKCKGNICLGTSANPKYKGYCSHCYQHLFPNDSLTLQMRSKTKEIAIRDFINLNFEGFQHDKPLWTGNCDCTHRRKIDHRKLFGNTLLCIETDENQHKGYNKDDEEIRYDDLFMLHGGKFIFIRFNPDKFKDKTGKSVNPMLYTRLPALKEEIEKQIKRIENEEHKELLEIIKLYYDEIKN